MTMKLKKWKPLEAIDDVTAFFGLHYDTEGFRVIIKNMDVQGRAFRLSFVPLCFRVIDEGDYLLTTFAASERGSLFIVEDSEFARWFVKESKGLHDLKNIIHYAIYTDNECVDILTKIEPEVTAAKFG